MVPETMSLSIPVSEIDTLDELTPHVSLHALNASPAPASAVVSSVKLGLLLDVAWLPALSVTEAVTVMVLFFFNDTATTEIYTLSLHDALPILSAAVRL